MSALSSEENAFLYFECYQFVLRGQIQRFVELGFPNDLEVHLYKCQLRVGCCFGVMGIIHYIVRSQSSS
jgi:hypothetical protein